MVFRDPVRGVGGEVLTDRSIVRSVEVHRISPIVASALFVEVMVGERVMVASIGTEMVVDDVEDHTETQLVRTVDEPAHVVRLAINVVRSEQVHTVVSPAELAGKLG